MQDRATAPATPRAIAVLLDEHAEGHYYLDPLQELPAAAGDLGPGHVREILAAAAEALAYLEGPIEEHIAKEEEPLFPRLKARLPDDDRLIDEMIAEHDQVRIQRDGLRAAIEHILTDHDDVRAGRDALRAAVDAVTESPDPAAVAALLKVARHVADAALVHFENEEELVFPLAPRLLTDDELAAAAEEMDAIAARYAAAAP